MKLTKEWVEAELKRAEQQEPHRPPEEEYAFYIAVRDGNIEYVQKIAPPKCSATRSEWEFCQKIRFKI